MMSAEKQSYLSGRESYILIKGYKTKKKNIFAFE